MEYKGYNIEDTAHGDLPAKVTLKGKYVNRFDSVGSAKYAIDIEDLPKQEEPPKEVDRKLTIGGEYRVIVKDKKHGFAVGQKVTVTDYDKGIDKYVAESLGDWYYMASNELELESEIRST